MQGFKWDKTKSDVALGLAEGKTKEQVASENGIDPSTVYRWLKHPEFLGEVDKLTLMTGIAAKAERIKIAKKVIAQKTKNLEQVETNRDLLDWLKYVQSELEGAKILLETVLNNADNSPSAPKSEGNITGAAEG